MAKGESWRDTARPIIAQVLADNKDKPEGEIKRALKAAYPFGERKYHPYKIWCDEIRIQRGFRRFGEAVTKKNPNQQTLF